MEETGLSKIRSNEVSSAVYDALLAELRTFAEFEVEVKKTSLHISHGRAFLGVHPRKDGLLLNIVTDKQIESDRIKKAERVSANRYHNEIVLSSPDELDFEVVNWLKQAYSLVA